MHRKKVKKKKKIWEEFFFLEKPVFFRAKNKTVIRRGPNPNVCLLVWGFVTLVLGKETMNENQIVFKILR